MEGKSKIRSVLNIPQLERQSAYIQSKVEEQEELNQSLRYRDKLKDDAILQLSDQLWNYQQGYSKLKEDNNS